MKIALITDQHFGIKGDVTYMLDYQEKFYRNVFFPLLKERKISTIINLGDLFDRRKYINFNTLQRTKDMFLDIVGNKYDNTDYKMYLIAGNHDVFHKSSNEVNSLNLLLKEYPNITVVDNECLILNDNLILVPWINAENYNTIMKTITTTKAKVLFGHLELVGFDMYKGTKNEHGMNPDIFNEKFDRVFSGHFHTKSNVGGIHYLGAPMEFTFADCDDPRGFHIFDTETQELEFIQNPYTLYEKIYYYDDVKDRQDYFKNFDYSKLEGKVVKVFVCKKTKPGLYDSFVDGLTKVDVINLSIHEDYSEFSADNVSIEETGHMTTKDLMEQYIDSVDTELDKQKLKSMISSIYTEALHTEI